MYVLIVKTGQCLRLINGNVDSKDETNVVSMYINPLDRLQLNQSFVLLENILLINYELCVGEENEI